MTGKKEKTPEKAETPTATTTKDDTSKEESKTPEEPVKDKVVKEVITGPELPASGRYTFTEKTAVYTTPSTNSSVSFYFNKGNQVNYDKVLDAENARWISYVSYSGIRRYAKVGELTKVLEEVTEPESTETSKNRKPQSATGTYVFQDTAQVRNDPKLSSPVQFEFKKGEEMLPQKARGFAYSIGIERDFNLFNAHYLHAETELNGKTYWNHHDYDDLYNRTYLGYIHKGAKQTLSVLPFYERRWYGNHRYHWGNGVRTEYQRWLSPNWQITTALEWGKQYYFENRYQNGSNKLASTTLLWLRNPRQYFYIGADVNDERTQVKRYSSTLKGLRFGWGQEWEYGISTRLNMGISQRHFKDKAILGDILPLGKIRKDII